MYPPRKGVLRATSVPNEASKQAASDSSHFLGLRSGAAQGDRGPLGSRVGPHRRPVTGHRVAVDPQDDVRGTFAQPPVVGPVVLLQQALDERLAERLVLEQDSLKV